MYTQCDLRVTKYGYEGMHGTPRDHTWSREWQSMDGTALTTGVAGRSSLFNATYNVNITSKQNEEAQKSRYISIQG